MYIIAFFSTLALRILVLTSCKCNVFFIFLFLSYPSVEEHHDAEEEVYFPWIKSKAEYPEKEFSISHEILSAKMESMKVACEAICQRRGRDCVVEIATLKGSVPAFVSNMRAHLREEEETIPVLLRDNFTREEEGEIVGRIAQAGGLTLTQKFLPAILLAMREWATPDAYEELCASLPPPVSQLVFEVRDFGLSIAMARERLFRVCPFPLFAPVLSLSSYTMLEIFAPLREYGHAHERRSYIEGGNGTAPAICVMGDILGLEIQMKGNRH